MRAPPMWRATNLRRCPPCRPPGTVPLYPLLRPPLPSSAVCRRLVRRHRPTRIDGPATRQFGPVHSGDGRDPVSIDHLIDTYGYWAVFGFVAVESFGIPLPGETALIAAATYAGATHRLTVWVIFLVGAAAAILGDTGGYWIGDKGGYRLLRRYGHYVRFDEPKIKVARYLFARHGGKVVFFGRFVSVLRTYAAFLAGTTRMRYRRFLVFNAA